MAEETANLPEQQQETPVIAEQATTEQVVQTPQISDEQMQAYLKSQLGFDGDISALKQKLTPAPSEEEVSAKQRDEDKKLLDVFLKNGGTIEDFTHMKGLLSADDIEVGRKAALKELADDGFTPEQAEAKLKVRYFQKELNDLDREDFDSDEEFEAEKAALQKEIDFGKKKLVAKAKSIKQRIEEGFNGLRQVSANEELRVKKEAEFSSKVDEFASKLPRKITLDLGESDGRKLDPIPYDVSEQAIAEVAETLKDASKRNELFFDKEGDINISTVAELMLRNKMLESAVKASYLTGETRQAQVIESIYPGRTAYQVGVGGAPHKKDTKPGKLVKVGQPRVATFPQN